MSGSQTDVIGTSVGVYKHKAFQVLSQDLEWPPQRHFRFRVPQGPPDL